MIDMKIDMKPVVDCYELQDALRDYLDDKQFSLGNIFFELAENDSIQLIDTSLDSLEEIGEEIEYYEKNNMDTSKSWKKYKALLAMRKLFPNYEEILVNFYW